jgi:hypothetical protein
MGTEKHLTRRIMALILGVAKKDMKNNGLGMTKGTPNHRALGVACGYGWALQFGTAAQKNQAKAEVENLFRFQNDGGHYTWAETNECLTASHYNWWGTALAALRWFARKNNDARVLDLTGTWWKQEMALLALMSVPSGKLKGSIVAPGGRTVYMAAKPASGGSVPRDVVYGLILGTNPKPDKWFKNAVEPLSYYQTIDEAKEALEPQEEKLVPAAAAKLMETLAAAEPKKPDIPFLDITAPWIVRDLLKAGDDFAGARKAAQDALAGSPSKLPKLVDRLHIVRTPTGHVAWFDDLTGTKNEPPQFWALCDYGAGTQEYGLSRPSPLPPAPPGGFAGRPRIDV